MATKKWQFGLPEELKWALEIKLKNMAFAAPIIQDLNNKTKAEIEEKINVFYKEETLVKNSGKFTLPTDLYRIGVPSVNNIVADLASHDDIKYINMPNDLKGKYQYYTQATMNKINSVGFNSNFMNLKEGVTDYLKNYLLTSDRYA